MSYVALPHLLSFLMHSLVFLLPVSTVAQSYRNVSLGSSLTATRTSSSWLSPSGEFAFGFHPLNTKDSFLLAIWFDKIPDKTIVWYPEGIQSVPKGSKVELTNDGRLVLTDQQGKELWNATSSTTGNNYAAMLDTGNFIITGTNSIALWESFKNPTDTILPTQTLELGGKLYSHQAVNSYSKGRFRLRLLEDGNLVLNTVAFPSLKEVQYDAYYHSDTNDTTKKSNVGYELVFNETGDIYVVRRNGSIVNLSWENKVLNSGLYYRATLDPDGVFVQYSHPKNSRGNQSWSMERLIPDNICSAIAIVGLYGSGACGYNSYCVLTSEMRPSCQCPPRYSYVDPNNTFAGCKPNFIQGCQEDEENKSTEDVFEFKQLDRVFWLWSDYEKLEPYTEQECQNSCMNDCQCPVAIYVNGKTCWKKKLPLTNGILSPDWNGKALIKVRKDGLSNQSNCSRLSDTDKKNSASGDKSSRSTLILVGSILFGSSIFLNLIFLYAKFVFYFFMGEKNLRTTHHLVPSVVGTNLHSFTYKDLDESTEGFKEELGRGAFGIVYKGEVEEMGSRNHVAVKKLDKVINKGEKEFKTEVSVIGKTHHKNLVRLLGFCEEGQQRLLVYEFMPNGSLADYLFGTSKPEWNQRIQIAFGIARGLVYLHAECSSQIIHCDIKPQNILLDECYTAKISDFGLAKLLMNEQTQTLTGIRGTRGYVAPEWFRNTQITTKVDVYSFGVVLLEIICCRRCVHMDPVVLEERAILTDWAYDCYKAGNLTDLVENDENTINDMRMFERLLMITIWCIQEDPALRPSMKKVIQMLEGLVEVPNPPCPYPF